MTLDGLLARDMADFGARLAASLTHKKLSPGFDPMLALLRAASSADAVPILRQALTAQVYEPLAARLQGDTQMERAALIGALLVGFDLVTRVLGLNASSDGTLDALELTLSATVQRLVDRP